MYTWTMLTEFDCQSATCVKNAVVFYYTHTLHPPFNAFHIYIWPCFVMLKLPYQNCSKGLTLQPVLNLPKGSFGQKKPVHCSFQGKRFRS